jgi:Kdo2-lipid IVA lauroyltransferase/acyltransferase
MVGAKKSKAWYKRGTGPIAWLMYAAVRSAFAIMQVFPVEWNLRTARLLAHVWKWLLPRHHRRAVEHLRIAFGAPCSEFELHRQADRCLEGVAMFAVEAVCLPRVINQFTFNRHVDLVNFKEVLHLLTTGQGFILVTGHYGPFELPGHLLALLGFDVHAVMRPLDNDYLNRFIVRSRRTHGLRLIEKKGATASAEAIIRDGGLLGFIGDQDAGRKGLFVDFFGRPASTYKSIGLLAMSTECPIVVGYARRRGHLAHYEIGVERIIRPAEWSDQPDQLRWITQAYTTAIESIVRAEPSQYLWIHRRWKSQPKVRREQAGMVAN